ncbi:MAG: beta-N-acetylhexosaminidase [Ferruginibacter sp.]
MTITKYQNQLNSIFFSIFFCLTSLITSASELSEPGLHVIPYPKQVVIKGDDFGFNNYLNIVLDKNHTKADEFTAYEFIADLKREWNIDARISAVSAEFTIILTRQKIGSKLGAQGYQIMVSKNALTISAKGEDGLFYGTQTALQLIQKTAAGFKIPGLQITDWPDILERAVHYDTKHHQDKKSYVKSFIKDLARYKVNILVWEWEDKFLYPSHPEIAAAGAFSTAEIQELTDYARKYHIQIVPLVQGLGHVSYILKWPQYAKLREIEASNWEFCPLNEGTYDLLFDLWKDAVNATRGSEYIHIGSDETYELGLCAQCKIKADQIGKSGVYHTFCKRAAEYLQSFKRKVMAWERPMGWKYNESPIKDMMPAKNLILTESYDDSTDFRVLKEAKGLGYKVFLYDLNPGTEQLFLPYFYRENEHSGERISGCLENSFAALTAGVASGNFDGMIRTSWDDAGLHNQVWMMSFVMSAAYSWNGKAPDLSGFKESFFKNYYGEAAVGMEELFYLLNEGAYYYMSTFERKVWHAGEVGKTSLPDLPRGSNIEYDPFWNSRYKNMITRSQSQLVKIEKALQIIETNKKPGIKNQFDFEIFQSIAQLIRHTCLTYLDLSRLENAIREAQENTYIDRVSAFNSLKNAEKIVENILSRRRQVFDNLVNVWGKSRLPKGMSTNDKKYFFQEDRARHFANRKPDMDYLIYDEQKLDFEGYLEKLKAYTERYRSNSF